MTGVTVRDLMTTDVATLRADDTLRKAREAMSHMRIRHIPVVDERRGMVGLVTQRDVLAATVSALATLDGSERDELEDSIALSDIMIREPHAIDPEMELRDAAALMLKHKWGCLPVVEGGRLAGIVTEADFLKLIVQMLEAEPA